MKHSLLFCFALLCASMVSGQIQMNLPVNFEDAMVDYSVLGFEGAENSTIVTDPTDPSNTVAQVVKGIDAGAYAGTTLTNANEDGFSAGVPFTAEVKTINVRVWTPQAGIPLLLKVEDSNNPTIFVETLKTSTVGGAWEIITFNFANPAPNPSAINFANTYNKLSIFFNFGISGETAGEQTYYFDDVEMGQGGKSAISNVTFRVDMNEVAENFTTPEVNGTFNNWCGNCAPMTDEDGDGVWELVIALEPGMYEYKFSYDAWAGQEVLLPGSSCTMTTGAFTNRVIQVSEDTVLDVVCWASCGACGTNSGPYPVTFQVDMSQYAGAFTTPEVNGNFNNWCGNCAPMTDVNGDNIWEIIIPLSAGNYEYKFSFDGWAGQEALTPGGACTVTTDAFTNRTLTVSDDVVLTPVCWESCAACIVSTHDLTTAAISVYPNPSNEYLTIAANNNDLGNIQVYGANGQLVFTGKTSIGGNTKISTAAWPVGIYHVQVIQNGQVSNFSQIIEH